jgi:uncharacterized protein YlzI (FlbEa/FlbD family)
MSGDSIRDTIPKSELIAINAALAKLATEQTNTRTQVLEPLVKDVREVRDTSRGTDQAFRIHLKECERLEERVTVVEECEIEHECSHEEDFGRIDESLLGHSRTLKVFVTVAMMLFLPIIGTLIYSVRAEETLRSNVRMNTKTNTEMKTSFDEHVKQQSEDIDALSNAIDGVPNKVATIVNGKVELSDEEIEELVSKINSLSERRQARVLLRKLRTKHR